MSMKKDEGRAFIKTLPGDLRLSQSDRCSRRQCVPPPKIAPSTPCVKPSTILATWWGKIVNSLNGNHLRITADHGFLFQETPPGQTDKNSIASKPAGTLLAKKRYLLGGICPKRQSLSWIHRGHGWCRRRDGVLGAEGGQPLHFVGGCALHGGAMPRIRCRFSACTTL